MVDLEKIHSFIWEPCEGVTYKLITCGDETCCCCLPFGDALKQVKLSCSGVAASDV